MKTVTLGAVVLLVCVADRALAQGVGTRSTHVLVEPHHSSTVDEGVLRGLGIFYWGLGRSIEATGRAMVDVESAREKAYQNEKSRVATHYEKVRMYEERKAEQAARRPQPSAQSVMEFERKLLPARLDAAQLTAAGDIDWPELLKADEYRQSREMLVKLFRQRATLGDARRKEVVRKAIDDEAVRLMASLKGRIDTYTVKDYLSARKFIDSLKYEAKFAPTVTLVARK